MLTIFFSYGNIYRFTEGQRVWSSEGFFSKSSLIELTCWWLRLLVREWVGEWKVIYGGVINRSYFFFVLHNPSVRLRNIFRIKISVGNENIDIMVLWPHTDSLSLAPLSFSVLIFFFMTRTYLIVTNKLYVVQTYTHTHTHIYLQIKSYHIFIIAKKFQI